jgi:hypothetical protein
LDISESEYKKQLASLKAKLQSRMSGTQATAGMSDDDLNNDLSQ